MTRYTDDDVRAAVAAIAPMFGDGVLAAPEVADARSYYAMVRDA